MTKMTTKKDDQVQQILASLISTTKINDSSRLASRIQDRLYRSMKKKYSGVKNLGVKEGPFFVLHDTNMASVLVEVGFLTNTREESRLKQSAYLDRLANSIAQGIAEYIRERGPMI
ncbi:MAG: N-acetylmuramoyl-L-alanine amidase [Nitrospinae bacterium]|nr:N-acetylmuramoyl-L-alanine amidase [Nitrospinota bacterium]